MPEIKNQFTSGKMNKDHDERLVPNGEYRDALNVDILTSEGSDVGSAQNSLGNSMVSTLGQVGNVTVGVCKYGRADKILWLVAGTTETDTKIDLIAEYNVAGEMVKPVLVDVYQWKGVVSSAAQGSTTVTLDGSIGTYNIRRDMTFSIGSVTYTVGAVNGNTITLTSSLTAAIPNGTTIIFNAERVLNFSSNRYITGINAIDGFLYWTDNYSEPKKIHIKRCASATLDSTSHTKLIIDGTDHGYIRERDVTVIKKYPLNAPTLTMANSQVGGQISSSLTTPANMFHYREGDQNGDVIVVPSGTRHGANVLDDNGDPIKDYTSSSSGVNLQLDGTGFQFSPANLSWSVGDQLKLTTEIETVDYEVRLSITGITNTSSNTVVRASVLSISSRLPNIEIDWVAVLERKDPLYELVFPRFAYRWKYVDGEYSVMSPFSTVAFLPEKEVGFDYEPEKGYNLAMLNQLRDLTISGFDSKPADAIEVDILYKESNSTNIYVVETLKENEQSFEVKNEISQGILPSNQILRPYDNVPRYAKAQEVSANRLIYGNYTQQYSIPEDASFELELTSNDVSPGIPKTSMKSVRTYQVGAVFLDAYGRQTPVFSSDNASVTIPQSLAVKQNKLRVRLTSNTPDWATHVKYFIKEPSSEYYNMAMDRWYDAEDGNVWISFPSSERNKCAVDDFLILKKEHSSDIAVASDNGGTVKYKVLAIENEAPDFLKEQKNSIGRIDTQFGRGEDVTDGFPIEDTLRIVIPGPNIADTSLGEIALNTIANKFFRIKSQSGNVSEWYAVESVARENRSGAADDFGDTNDYYIVTSKTPLGQDITFTGTPGNKLAGLQFEWAEENVDLYNSEYAGRFFVKIYKDSLLDEHILSDDNANEYGIVYNEKMYFLNQSANSRDEYNGRQVWAIDTREADKGSGMTYVNPRIGEGIRRGSKKLDLTIWGWGDDEWPSWQYPSRSDLSGSDTYFDIYQRLRKPGTYLRWTDDPDQSVYKIKQTRTEYILNYHDSYGWHDNYDEWGSNHAIRMKLVLDKPSYWDPTRAGQFGGVSPSDTQSENSSGQNQYPLTCWDADRGQSKKSFTRLQFLKKVNDGVTYASENPAIFETEPKERADLNLYYETSKTYTVAELANTNTDGGWRELDWFNCYSFGNGVESNRIRDDFNAVTIDKGPKVSTVLAEQYKTENKQNSMIWSGIYNSSSGVNRTNEFIQAEAITKDLNPSYGSIQKMFTRRGDVVVFCEDKTLKVLSNKDALFNADGSSNLLASSKVLGQTIPFQGEYGISRNPESFANFAFRIYYADKNRNAILRLSGDGIEELTRYGMKDYFKDKLNASSGNMIIGSYDMDKNNYNLTLGPLNSRETVSFTELTKGWTSRKSFLQENGVSLNGKYYTFKNGELWEHNSNALRNNFYGTQYHSSIKFIFNEAPSVVKNFKTVNYEGTQSQIIPNVNDTRYDNNTAKVGWHCGSLETDQQSGHITEFINKEGKWFNYIKGVNTTWNNVQNRGNLDIAEFSSQGIGNLLNISGEVNPASFVLTIQGGTGFDGVYFNQGISFGYPTNSGDDYIYTYDSLGLGNINCKHVYAAGILYNSGNGLETYPPIEYKGGMLYKRSTDSYAVGTQLYSDINGLSTFYPGVSRKFVANISTSDSQYGSNGYPIIWNESNNTRGLFALNHNSNSNNISNNWKVISTDSNGIITAVQNYNSGGCY